MREGQAENTLSSSKSKALNSAKSVGARVSFTQCVNKDQLPIHWRIEQI